MEQPRVGVIGGSGLYDMEGLEVVDRVAVETPFGTPSDQLTIGSIDGIPVAFLPRHGRHHQIGPSRVPARANIWALKALGVGTVVSVSAVGSLRETIHPLDLVVPDQIFDRTTYRPRTFFDDIVVHVSLAEPFCPVARRVVIEAAAETPSRVHEGGTYVCIEGPQFSTKAESRIYRSWDVDIIGMTAMPEARLAREAQLCYVMLAMVTDYDVWHETEDAVSVHAVVENLRKNVKSAQQIIREALPRLVAPEECDCGTALEHAVATDPEGMSDEGRSLLSFLRETSAGGG